MKNKKAIIILIISLIILIYGIVVIVDNKFNNEFCNDESHRKGTSVDPYCCFCGGKIHSSGLDSVQSPHEMVCTAEDNTECIYCSVCGKKIEKIQNKDKESEQTEEFVLDTDNKYLFQTNEHFMTMQNDGGSHVDRYYQIDLDKRKVELLADKYKGFEGWEYQGRILYSKVLSSEETNNLKRVLNRMIENKDLINEDELELSERFNHYTLSTKQYKDIKVYDKELINEFLGILEINN